MSITRRQRSRKVRTCSYCGRTINPGDSYFVIVSLPTTVSIPIGGGDYEVESYDFTAIDSCSPSGECLDYEPDLWAVRREEQQTIDSLS